MVTRKELASARTLCESVSVKWASSEVKPTSMNKKGFKALTRGLTEPVVRAHERWKAPDLRMLPTKAGLAVVLQK